MSEDKFTKSERFALDEIMAALKDAMPLGFKSQPVYVANATEIAPRMCIIRVSMYRYALVAVDPEAVGHSYEAGPLLTKPLVMKDCRRLFSFINQMAAIVWAQRGREQPAKTQEAT